MVGAAFAGGIVGLGVSPILFDIKNNTDISDGDIGKVAEKVAENLIKDSDVVDTLIENSENIRKAGGLEEAIKEVEQKQKEGQPINSVEQKLVKLKEEPKQKQEEMKKKETPTQEAKALIREKQQPTQEQAKKEPWEMTREEYWEATKEHRIAAIYPEQKANLIQKLKTLKKEKETAKGRNTIKRIERLIADTENKLENLLKGKLVDKESAVLRKKNESEFQHKNLIHQALSEGKPVPPEVLKDYSDLAERYGKAQKKTEKEMNDEVDINDKQELGRPLPKDMKPVGNEFWVEIMDAAKKLVPEYRYKALRKNIKGSFHQEKGIKLQDVRSVTTATHELGHSIDYKMNGNRFPSKIKDRFPNAQGTERELRAELKAVSRRMRPDLWEANNGKGTKYANKHSELMADFISHYILDPEASRKLAPNVTEAFEEKLPKDIKEIIDGLHKNRGAGKETSPISEIVKKKIKIDNKDLRLAIREGEDYVKQADKLAVDKVRNQTVQLRRAYEEAKRIDELVPDAKRQMDLMVLADGSKENPWTGQSAQEIEKSLNENEKKALKLFRS